MGLKESGLRGSLRNVSVGIAAIPDEGLLRNYEINEGGTETTIIDYASGEDGTANHSDWESNKGRDEPILKHNGTSDTITIPDVKALDGEFTFALTIYTENPSESDTFAILRKNNNIGFRCRPTENDIELLIEGESGGVNIDTSLPEQEWVSLVGRRDENDDVFFDVNASNVGSGNISGNNDSNNGPDAIMSREDDDRYAPGFPAEFRIYEEFYTLEEFSKPYHETFAGSWNN